METDPAPLSSLCRPALAGIIGCRPKTAVAGATSEQRRRASDTNGETGEMGRLTTHVLDTVAGAPAAGLTIELRAIGAAGEDPRLLRTVVTNSDGRADAPLLEGGDLTAGLYELRFRAGEYLRARHGVEADPPFLDEVPVRFGIADPAQHYHVPLLLSAYGYSTYRGS